ncbi:unnamed protein product [Pieris macdunnoughi]|uniref:Uncharacterized protein n=1 Tax=Pieris macdunnoughi TaxID=345717 RepID=A0A821M3P6_9NEOP|nr:unnamed protein product [Pieris macdunnoughi]
MECARAAERMQSRAHFGGRSLRRADVPRPPPWPRPSVVISSTKHITNYAPRPVTDRRDLALCPPHANHSIKNSSFLFLVLSMRRKFE